MAPKRSVTLSTGTGKRSYRIPVADLAEESRDDTVREALINVVSRNIKDPMLLRQLQDPRMGLGLIDRGGGGDDEEEMLERPVSLDFERVGDVVDEIGEYSEPWLQGARANEGGAPRGRVVNPVVTHPEDYELTAADLADLEAGRALFIRGRALAKAELISRLAGPEECMWHFIACPEAPAVIDDLYLPWQEVSTGFVSVDPTEVGRIARRADADGRRVVALGHSHGNLGVFSSRVDRRQMRDLPVDDVGFDLSANPAPAAEKEV